MAILWALAAAVGFGTADFIARGASQREGSLKTLFYLQVIGLPFALALVLGGEGLAWGRILSPTGAAGALISMELAVGTVLLYRALALGPLLIVSPVASSFAAVTAALSLLWGERPGELQLVGIVVTLAGVALSAITTRAVERNPTNPGETTLGLPTGVALAIGASLLWGVGLFAFRFVVPVVGSQAMVLVMRVSALCFLGILFLASQRQAGLIETASLKWLLPMGLIDTASNWFYNQGLLSGLTSIVAVVTSLFSVVTMLLGYLILKERITRTQQAGILVTLVGVALVSM